MSWLSDSSTPILVLLGLIAAGLISFWWLDRRRKQMLYYALGVLGLMGAFWLLASRAPSDRRQLEDTAEALRRAILDGKKDDFLKHVAAEFRYKEITRDTLFERARGELKANRVKGVGISKFTVDELSREKKRAKTSFRVTVWAEGDDLAPSGMFGMQAEFLLDGDRWKLSAARDVPLR